MENRQQTYTLWAPRLAVATAFLIPIKLSLTYITLIPFILLWLYEERKNLLSAERSPMRNDSALIFFILSLFISSLFGLRPLHSLENLGRLSFYLCGAFAYATLFRQGQLKPILQALILGQSLAALYTVLHLLLPSLPQNLFVGVISESGQLALSVLICTGIIFHQRLQPESGSRRPWWPNICLVLLLLALIINLKRGPWLGVCVGSAVFFFMYSRRILLPLFLSVLLLALVIEPVRNRLAHSYDHFVISGGRSSIWEVGAELAAKYPLGIGYENSPFLRKYSQEIPAELTHFHNNLLNIAVETGWAGLFLYLWWMLILFRRSFCSRVSDPGDRLLLRAFGCALLSWQCAGLVEYNFGDSEVLFVALLAIGGISALSRPGHEELQHS